MLFRSHCSGRVSLTCSLLRFLILFYSQYQWGGFGHVLNELGFVFVCVFSILCAVPQGDHLQSKLPAHHRNKDDKIDN